MHPAYAWQHYHVKPGGTYISDKDHAPHRFQDKTGAKAFNNEDFYKGSSAGDTHVHLHIDAIDGASVHSFLDSHGDKIVRHVHDAISDSRSRSAAV